MLKIRSMRGKGPGLAGAALAVLSAGTFGLSGIFASALISAGWSPAAAAMARLGGGAFLLAVPAVVQLRGRWVLLRREAGRVVLYGPGRHRRRSAVLLQRY